MAIFKKSKPPMPSDEVMRASTRMFLGEYFEVELEKGRFPSAAAWLNRAANVNLWEDDSASVPQVFRRAADLTEGGMQGVLGDIHRRIVELENSENPTQGELIELHDEVTRVLQALMYWAAKGISGEFPDWAKKYGYYMGFGNDLDPSAKEALIISLLRDELNRLSMACTLQHPPVRPHQAFGGAANMLIEKANALHDAAKADAVPPPWSISS